MTVLILKGQERSSALYCCFYLGSCSHAFISTSRLQLHLFKTNIYVPTKGAFCLNNECNLIS